MAARLFSRPELVAAIANDLDIPITDARKALDSAFDNIEKALLAGKYVRIGRVGSLRPRNYKARSATMPLTGTTYELPDRRGVAFVRSRKFSENLNSV